MSSSKKKRRKQKTKTATGKWLKWYFKKRTCRRALVRVPSK